MTNWSYRFIHTLSFLLFMGVVSSCRAAPSTPSPAPTALPSSSSKPLSLTPTASATYIRKTSIAIPGELLPSPDGSLLIGWDIDVRTVSLCDLHGQILGKYTSKNGAMLSAYWLPDSSGVFIWDKILDMGQKPSPIMVMDRTGLVHSTGLEGINPFLSQDGNWIAAEKIGSSSPENDVEIVSRDGGVAQPIGQGKNVHFLGWDRNEIIYFSPGGIYKISPDGKNTHLLSSLPSDYEVDLPVDRPIISPDSKVTIVLVNHVEFALAEGKLLSFSNEPGAIALLLLGSHPLWVEPHDAISFSPTGELLFIDMMSGTVEKNTGIYNIDSPEAISWPWLAWRKGTIIHLINLTNGTDINLGEEPVGGEIDPLNQGQFLLHGNGQTYLISAPS